MRLRLMAGLLLGLVLLLSACGSADGNGGGSGDGNGGGGGAGLTGTLIGESPGGIHAFELGSGRDWLERLSISTGYDVVAIHLPANELYVAGLNFLDPMDVDVRDLSTFGLKDEWLWPETADPGRVDGLAIAPDGGHAAALLRSLGDNFLQILDLRTREIVVAELYAVTGTDITWISDTKLMFAMDLQDQEPDFHGGIVAMDFADIFAGGSDLTFEVLAGFNEAQWSSGSSLHSFALSNDGTQLVFSRSGDLWVKELHSDSQPHQLTTGPTALMGAAFSPDDRVIAFVEYHSYGLENTFVIPNHRSAPILIDASTPAGSELLLDRSNLVDRILAWLP